MNTTLPLWQRAWAVWVCYFLIICIVLIQLPLQGSLPGSTDSWFNLYFFRYYADYVKYWLEGAEIYKPFYPSNYPAFMLGEPSFFGSLIYNPVEWVIKDRIWAYNIYVAIVISLNGLAARALALKLWENPFTANIAGALLMLSGYTFCSLDQENVLSYYPALFCLNFAESYMQKQKQLCAWIALFWYVVQIYCSGYHFVFLNVALFVLFAYHFKVVKQHTIRSFTWLMAVIALLLIFPYAYMYLGTDLMLNTLNDVDQGDRIRLSMKLENWFFAHPYNIWYGHRQDETLSYFMRAISPGWMLLIGACLGAYILRGRKVLGLLLASIFASLLIAAGPKWQFGSRELYSPLFFLPDKLGLDNLLRIPVRAYIMSHIVFCLLAAGAVAYFYQLKKWMGILALSLFALDNIPYKLQTFESWRYIEPPKELYEVTAQMREGEVLWITPSSVNSYDKLFPGLTEENREYIYMYWQSVFKRDMVNGLNAFMPFKNLDFRGRLLAGDSTALKRVTSVYVPQMEISLPE